MSENCKHAFRWYKNCMCPMDSCKYVIYFYKRQFTHSNAFYALNATLFSLQYQIESEYHMDWNSGISLFILLAYWVNSIQLKEYDSLLVSTTIRLQSSRNPYHYKMQEKHTINYFYTHKSYCVWAICQFGIRVNFLVLHFQAHKWQDNKSK